MYIWLKLLAFWTWGAGAVWAYQFRLHTWALQVHECECECELQGRQESPEHRAGRQESPKLERPKTWVRFKTAASGSCADNYAPLILKAEKGITSHFYYIVTLLCTTPLFILFNHIFSIIPRGYLNKKPPLTIIPLNYFKNLKNHHGILIRVSGILLLLLPVYVYKNKRHQPRT